MIYTIIYGYSLAMQNIQINRTHVARIFLSASATGLRENLGFGFPSGLPRWLIRTTDLAPCSSAYLIVGTAASILGAKRD